MESLAQNTLQQNDSAECFRGVVIPKEEIIEMLKKDESVQTQPINELTNQTKNSEC